MAIFSGVVSALLLAEGGYTPGLPGDPGGETKYGISKRSYPNVDIEKLTPVQAEAIYQRDFWDANNLTTIISQNIANEIFLALINLGEHAAVTAVQEAVKSFTPTQIIDGNLGPVTISTINLLPQAWLADKIRIQLISHYLAIVTANTADVKFLPSWIRRSLL